MTTLRLVIEHAVFQRYSNASQTEAAEESKTVNFSELFTKHRFCELLTYNECASVNYLDRWDINASQRGAVMECTCFDSFQICAKLYIGHASTTSECLTSDSLNTWKSHPP
mmetsp:Transcript_32958/g.49671  ORF Transcript_32958/g.49671 Transcript_32958/m.49671 type:complete len:111 (+) Transcript_32958:352-684(+)